jgi:adenylate cyclase
MELNPHHPAWYTTNLGLACYCSHAYADGAALYGSVAEPQVGVLAGLAACRAQLGEGEGAAMARTSLLAMAPSFRASLFVRNRPFKFVQDSEHLLDGLLKAGLGG